LEKRIVAESKHLREFAETAFNILERSNNYKRSKNIISDLYRIQSSDYFNDVVLRLTVIDSYYSTQVGSKRLFGIDDIANQLVEVGTDDDLKGKCQLFLEFPHKRNEISDLLNGKYGINKKGLAKGKAGSLVSKYLYFLMNYEFPIYDSLAIESYKKIRAKYEALDLGELERTFHVSYFEKLTNLKNIAGIDTFNKLDNLLWLIGKISQGSMSLILDREPYVNLMKSFRMTVGVSEDSDNQVDGLIKEFITKTDNIKGILKDNESEDRLIKFAEYSLNYLKA
jgi:hypothetical protein